MDRSKKKTEESYLKIRLANRNHTWLRCVVGPMPGPMSAGWRRRAGKGQELRPAGDVIVPPTAAGTG